MQRSLRLRRSEDFARLRREGVSRSHRLLVISVVPNDLPHNRYGFVVGKGVGSAVIRNRTKRRLRAVMRGLHPQLGASYDVVIVARRSVVEQPYEIVQRIVFDLLRQLGLIEGSYP